MAKFTISDTAHACEGARSPRKLPVLLLPEQTPANLWDLLLLRLRVLDSGLSAAGGAPRQGRAWADWRTGMQQLAASWAAHSCMRSRCPTCAALYVLAQVLEAKRRQLQAPGDARGTRERQRPLSPAVEQALLVQEHARQALMHSVQVCTQAWELRMQAQQLCQDRQARRRWQGEA